MRCNQKKKEEKKKRNLYIAFSYPSLILLYSFIGFSDPYHFKNHSVYQNYHRYRDMTIIFVPTIILIVGIHHVFIYYDHGSSSPSSSARAIIDMALQFCIFSYLIFLKILHCSFHFSLPIGSGIAFPGFSF